MNFFLKFLLVKTEISTRFNFVNVEIREKRVEANHTLEKLIYANM